MTLNQKFVDTVKPIDKKVRYPDDRVVGLTLKVQPSGAKAYTLRYRDVLGKQKEMTIGKATIITLASARKEALKLLSEISDGHDPAEIERRKLAERKKKALAQRETIASLYEQWRESAHWKGMRQATQDNYEITFRKHILPEIGDMTPGDVTRKVISDLISKLVETKSDYASIHAKTTLGSFGNFLVEKEFWEFNVANTVKHKGKRTVRTRILSSEELRDFWAHLNSAENADDPSRAMIKLNLFVPARISEVAAARVDWFDPHSKTLTIPRDVMKKDREFEYPLVDTAYELLKRRIDLGLVKNGFFFPDKSGESFMEGKRAGRLCARFANSNDLKSFGPHDIRRTFATKMAELGHSDSIIERCLSHEVNAGRAIANYNHFKYREPKLMLLRAWEKEFFRIAESKAEQMSLL